MCGTDELLSAEHEGDTGVRFALLMVYEVLVATFEDEEKHSGR